MTTSPPRKSRNPRNPRNPRSIFAGWTCRLSVLVMAVLLAGGATSLHAAPASSADAPASRPARPRADDRFVEIIAQARPAVVAIGSYHADDKPSVRYYGTGFAVSDGRLIVTNAHVVEAMRVRGRLGELRLYLPDTTSIHGISAKVIATDAHHDVAIILAATPIQPALELEMSRTPRQGETVAVLGYPIGTALGVVPAVHKGVISAVVPAVLPLPTGRRLTPELAEAIRRPYMLYQLDMVVYPGNSGSPLIDVESGKVIGIINKTLATRTREHLLERPSGISYAVPVRWIHNLLARTLITMETASHSSESQ